MANSRRDPIEDRKIPDQGLDIPIDEQELKQIIARELDQALGIEGSKLSTDRRTLLEYYEGEPFGNEVDGRSQVIMRSVLEAVEWVLPALLRIFTASGKLANFEPTIEGQEPAADQATEYVNHIIYKDNEGFMLLHDWFKDCLIQKLGWVKCWWDEQEVRKLNTYTGLTKQEYDAMLGDDVEVVEETSYPAPQDMVALTPQPGDFNEDAPSPGAPMLYDCKLRVTEKEGRVHIENVPPEEVLLSRRSKRGHTPYLCHRRERTYSDLIEEGYDEDALDMVPSYDAPQFNSERVARYQDEDDWPYQNERTDKPMRSLWVEENYLRVDYNGDGIAELCKVVTSGQGIIILTKDGKPDIEEIDEVPLISLCPIPMPHKIVGNALADLVTDLQLIKSVLMRQILDNIYLTNNPRHEVAESGATDETYDDLLTSRPGGVVRVKTPGTVNPLTTPFVAEGAFQVVEYIDQTQEIRTGVDRRNQGLSPDDLNKTAAAASMYQQAAAQRVELIARIFAETGIKDLSKMILGLVTKYQQRERVIRVTGKWVPMDPRQWQDSMQVEVDVGLGTGNRDMILSHLMQLLSVDEQIVKLQGGLQGPILTAQNLFDKLELLTTNAGFKQKLYTDPSEQPAGMPGAPGQQPNPEMMKAQHGMQIDAAKAQIDAHIAQQRLQGDLQIQQAQFAADRAIAEERMKFEMTLENQKAQHAMELERMREANEQARALREIELRAQAGAYTPGPAAVPQVPA